MADLTGVLRWNASFVKGLAESVLARARSIRSALPTAAASPDANESLGKRPSARRTKPKAALKKVAKKHKRAISTRSRTK